MLTPVNTVPGSLLHPALGNAPICVPDQLILIVMVAMVMAMGMTTGMGMSMVVWMTMGMGMTMVLSLCLFDIFDIFNDLHFAHPLRRPPTHSPSSLSIPCA